MKLFKYMLLVFYFVFTSCPTTRFWVVLACSTSHTSSANEDWVCMVTSPDFEVMYQQTRSFESVPRRGMVTGPRRSGDVPVVDHPPPESTRFVVTRVLQRLRPCSYRRTDRSGERSQRREASADRFASLLLLLLLLLLVKSPVRCSVSRVQR